MSRNLKRRLPFFTLAMLVAATFAYTFDSISSVLVYDRTAILSGEIWRLGTGQWVHFSRSHLLYNALAFGLAGAIIETKAYRHFVLLCGLSAVTIGVTLFWLDPQIHTFGGLSGIATAAIVFLCLHGLRETRPWRWMCFTVLGFLLVKIALEVGTGKFLLAQAEQEAFSPVPLSHITGALTALALYGLIAVRKSPLR